MNSLKLFTFLSLLALAPATGAFADSINTPDNPNCSPGVKGCTANFPTSDTSKDNPAAKQKADASNPNCTHGDRDCSANYPTGDAAKTGPQK